MKRKTISGILVILFLASIITSMLSFAHASEPPSITMTVEMTLTATDMNIDDFELIMKGTGAGTFTIVGDFSDSGTITETFELELNQADGTGEAKGVKYLYGSEGNIAASFEGAIEPYDGNSLVTGEWTILSGTGIYSDLRGEGSFRTIITGMTLVGTYIGLYD